MRYWTSSDRPIAEQLSYWRDVICQAFTPLATDRTDAHRASGPPEPGITSWVRSAVLCSTNCAEVSSRSQLISHGRRQVSSTRTEDVFVNLQVRGHCVVSQGDRTALVPAGSLAFVDTTREFQQEYIEDPQTGEWRVVSFRVPRASLIPLVAQPESFTAIAHNARDGGMAAIVASTLLSTWSNIEQLDRYGADAAESATTAVLAAVAGGSDALRDTSRETLDASLRVSVNRYLAANLRCGTDLSAPAVARHFGVSVRKLHSVYEGSGRTFAQTTMALRVGGCARELRNDGHSRSITQLASRGGFSDLSHINRVFRSHHGCLPSEYRSLHAQGESAPKSILPMREHPSAHLDAGQ